ncbi:MAG: peptidylprolyl isomerase [Gemmataceae bacterium]|nr:peptidylprolyl isomerase [Gemmataceae bacterium]
MWSGMRNGLRRIIQTIKLFPSSRIAAPTLTLAAVGLAFWAGRLMSLSSISAQAPASTTPPLPSANDDYSRRVVAYIYGNMPISRVDLAEFLIARFGAERIEYLVNRKIVELDCQAKGVTVTDAEVQAQFREDLQKFGPHMTLKEFESQVLKRFNKTVFEWKEDVVRPKLAMAKLVRPTIQVSQDDLTKGFEGRYGPKVACRMVVCQDKEMAFKVWNRISKAENIDTQFRVEARQQYLQHLSASGGEVPPVHKHFGDPRIEREAFSLKPGELSGVIEMADRTAIIMICDKHIPADTTVTLESKRLDLQKEIFELKLAQRIPEYFAELRKKANPQMLLSRELRQDQLEREVLPEIGAAPQPGGLKAGVAGSTPTAPGRPVGSPPQGN